MLNIDKVLKNAEDKYGIYVSHIARNPSLSKKLSGESKAIIEAIVEAINETEERKEV